MLTDLRRLTEKHPGTAAEELRAAAGELLARQFLFVENPRQRRHHRLVTAHHDYFSNLFDALGWSLHRDDELGFVGIVPLGEEPCLPLKLDETLLLLTARLLFDEGMEAFRAHQGAVWVEGEELLARYEALLKRERPKRARFLEILQLLARHGLVERDEAAGDELLPRLRLLPSLRVVTGEAVLKRLEGYVQEAAAGEDDDAA